MKRVEDESKTSVELDIINGLLLSDASLEWMSESANKTALLLSQCIKNKQLVEQMSDYLTKIGFSVTMSMSIRKDGIDLRLRTKYYTIFGNLKKLWYPEGKKIVPDSIRITEKTLAYWFMGDGSSSWTNNTVNVCLATNGFDDQSVMKLVQILKESFGINAIIFKAKKYVKTNYGSMILINKKDEVTKFMRVIEPHILTTFLYKLKYPKLNTRVEMIKKAKIRMKEIAMYSTRDRKGRFIRQL